MKWILAATLVVLSFAAFAAGKGPGAVRKQAEASLLVTGTIAIEADGSVTAVDLDSPEKLPQGIAAFVGSSAANWRFEPILDDGGKPAAVRTKMSVRLVGKSAGKGQMTVSIRGAEFGDYQARPEAERITGSKMTPPGYPESAAQVGAQGTVYLLVRVAPDGSVSEVATEQVNLRIIASEPQMNLFRNQFARTATAAARRWTFKPPTQGKDAQQTQWVVRVPVDFTFRDKREYGQWEAYVPGPRERIAWAQQDDPAFSPDALPDGGIYLAGSKGPKLLTPLTES